MGIFSSFFSFFGNTYEETKATNNQDTNYKVSNLTDKNTFYGASSLSYRRGVVGLGFNIRSKTADKEFNKKFNYIIKNWSRKTSKKGNRSNCELTGRYFFQEAQRQMVDEYAVKRGGFIVAHHYNKAFKYGYKFELISLDKIDTTKHNEQTNEYNGIKHNTQGEIVGIWIYKSDGTSRFIDYDKLTLVVNKYADIHQYSAISPLNRVIEALEYIDNYKAKEMEGAGKRAETPLIIKTPRYNEIFKAFLAENKDKVKNLYQAIKDFFDLRRLDKKNNVNKFEYIAGDEELIETGKGVFTIYNDMFTNETKASSAAIGLSAYSTSGIMPSSYNQALRAAQDEEANFAIYAQEIVESCLREIIEHHLLTACILYGHLKIDAEKLEEYQEIEFIRTEKGHIDPIKTAKAYTEDLTVNKTKSYQQALSEKGKDPSEHLSEIEEWEDEVLEMKKRLKEKYEKAGIKYEDNTPLSVITDDDIKDN